MNLEETKEKGIYEEQNISGEEIGRASCRERVSA